MSTGRIKDLLNSKQLALSGVAFNFSGGILLEKLSRGRRPRDYDRIDRCRMMIRCISIFCFLFLSTCAFAEGDVHDLKDFQYWENGKIKQCTIYDASNGKLKSIAFCRHDGTADKIERYDINGNKIEEALYDQSGKLKTGVDGWAAIRWRYDASTLRSQIAYNEYGKPIERKIYSESGKLIVRQYREGLDDVVPYEAASMALMLGGGNLKYPDQNVSVKDSVPTIKE